MVTLGGKNVTQARSNNKLLLYFIAETFPGIHTLEVVLYGPQWFSKHENKDSVCKAQLGDSRQPNTPPSTQSGDVFHTSDTLIKPVSQTQDH